MNKRPRYMLFGMDTYYPGGGSADVVGSFHTLQNAEEAINTQTPLRDDYEVLDLDTGQWLEVVLTPEGELK